MKNLTIRSIFLSLPLVVLAGNTQTWASDTEIYQAAQSGSKTLMFMLDISGSMSLPLAGYSACDVPSGEIISRFGVEDSNTSPSYKKNYCEVSGGDRYQYRFSRPLKKWYSCYNQRLIGTCIVPAEAPTASDLANYTKNSTLLSDYYSNYVDTVRYYDRITRVTDAVFNLLDGSNGVKKLEDNLSLGLSAFSYNGFGSNGYIVVPAKALDTAQRERLKNAVASFIAQGGTPTANAYAETAAYMLGNTTKGSLYSGFNSAQNRNETIRGNSYLQPSSISSNSQCGGQAIYILTDGFPNFSVGAEKLMQNALNDSSFKCNGVLNGGGDDYGWRCMSAFSKALLNGSTSIKTATVGFGTDFQELINSNVSYVKGDGLNKNIQAIDGSNVTSVDIKNMAKLGVYGQGGWYAATSSADIVNSVNNVVKDIPTQIPTVTTGAATIPIDWLNPSKSLLTAYLAQLQPTPGQDYKLWLGNLKKYKLFNGRLVDANNNNVFDSKGGIVQSNQDIWKNVNGSADGGVKSQLPLGVATNADTTNRKVLVNRSLDGSETNTSLTRVDAAQSLSSSDPDRGYLVSLLGFNINPNNPPTNVSTLRNMSELRQVGAVIHSSPILITNGGTINVSDTGNVTTSNREDYILFGTTQGLLHVVNESTGVEKFAFLPNEMVSYQKKGFLDATTTASTGPNVDSLRDIYYGVDAPWSSYSEYVPLQNNAVTVGVGLNNTQGMQMAYGGLRMGGRSYYALDLHDMNNPELAFRIDPNSGNVYSRDKGIMSYKELTFMAQSWSKPAIGYINWNGTKKLVLFVGGGYDAGGTNGDGFFNADGSRSYYGGYESETYNQTNKQGAGVYMFDAKTGQLLWWTGANATASNSTAGVNYIESSDMKYSIPSEIQTVDTNGDGLIDHLYFGDLGGQVWRIDINNRQAVKDSTNLVIKAPVRLLNLSNVNDPKFAPKFYEKPAFTSYLGSTGNFGVVSIGSGNRSRPLISFDGNQSYNNDAIYNVFDKDVLNAGIYQTETKNGQLGYTASANTFITNNINLQNQNISQKLLPLSQGQVNIQNSSGWYYYFGDSNTKKQVEKVMAMPIVLQGDLYVTTFDSSRQNAVLACGAGIKGGSNTYKFKLPYGSSSGSYTPPNPTDVGLGLVAPAIAPADSTTGEGRTLISPKSSPNGENPFDKYNSNKSLKRLSWYELNW